MVIANKASLKSLLFLTTISFTAIACSSDTDVQRQAQDFCDIHHVNSWQHITPDISVETLYQERTRRISKLIMSDPLREAIEWAEQRPKSQDTYLQLQRQIESLINESWACPEYLDFYAVSFVRVDGNEAAAKQHEIKIQVTDKHAYVLGGQTHTAITAEALLSALGEVDPADSRIRVILDQGATDDALPLVFSAAEAVGITSISVISD